MTTRLATLDDQPLRSRGHVLGMPTPAPNTEHGVGWLAD